ncbi:hypothetical protein GmHk_19G054402 [Glycine max]|nr:hypothetical protein GmHk_19G054402 [Glycine max]
MNLGISQSRISTPSQEVKQIGHLLILVGLFSIAGSFWGCLSCLGLRPISGPCNLYPELVWSRAEKEAKPWLCMLRLIWYRQSWVRTCARWLAACWRTKCRKYCSMTNAPAWPA